MQHALEAHAIFQSRSWSWRSCTVTLTIVGENVVDTAQERQAGERVEYGMAV